MWNKSVVQVRTDFLVSSDEGNATGYIATVCASTVENQIALNQTNLIVT